MDAAQSWAVIGLVGVFAAANVSLVVFALHNLRHYLDARFAAVDERFNTVDERFNTVDARFNAVETRIERVDRDLQSLIERFFRDRS